MIVSASGMVSGFIARPYQNIFTYAINYDAMYSFFMTRMRSPQNQTIEYLKEQTELMKEFVKITERIATALEKIQSK